MMINTEIPGVYFFSKDRRLRFLHCSQNMLESTGLYSANEIIGKTDFDLAWKDRAEFYRAIDQKILTEEFSYFNRIELQTQKDREAQILISKYPLLNKEGDCIGIGSHYIDISQYYLINKNGYSDHTTGRFYFYENATLQYFTPREVETLKLLMIGHQAKKIALMLKISKRTVDDHIDNIKLKLNCRTKAEIIIAVFKMGLSHLIFGETGFKKTSSTQ